MEILAPYNKGLPLPNHYLQGAEDSLVTIS